MKNDETYGFFSPKVFILLGKQETLKTLTANCHDYPRFLFGDATSNCQQVNGGDGLHLYVPGATSESTLHMVAVKCMFSKTNDGERTKIPFETGNPNLLTKVDTLPQQAMSTEGQRHSAMLCTLWSCQCCSVH